MTSKLPPSIVEAIGREFTSHGGYVWRWEERFSAYVCATPSCNAREAESHTPQCCAEAEARRFPVPVPVPTAEQES